MNLGLVTIRRLGCERVVDKDSCRDNGDTGNEGARSHSYRANGGEPSHVCGCTARYNNPLEAAESARFCPGFRQRRDRTSRACNGPRYRT
jgi:hypothetical protein